jgi:hypothetical protein
MKKAKNQYYKILVAEYGKEFADTKVKSVSDIMRAANKPYCELTKREKILCEQAEQYTYRENTMYPEWNQLDRETALAVLAIYSDKASGKTTMNFSDIVQYPFNDRRQFRDNAYDLVDFFFVAQPYQIVFLR